MIVFFVGIFVVNLLAIVALYFAIRTEKPAEPGVVYVDPRLETARKRLGQIANRESIGEARKIANKTLREIS
jgi:hypothetical protein